MKQAINDLLEGKDLVKSSDPFNNWQLVEQTLNETVQNQEEKLTLFDMTGLKVELDEDYYLEENEDFAEDSSSLATTDIQTEPDPMAWHPVVKNEFQENIGKKIIQLYRVSCFLLSVFEKGRRAC